MDYLRDMKPLLAERCYKCHGASQQKSGLRLDTVAFALKGGENGPSFKPGNSAESLMIQVVKGAHDEIAQMPYKKPPLAEAQIAVLAAWIDQGAGCRRKRTARIRQALVIHRPRSSARPRGCAMA